jgi:DNA-binding transcriptional ArsR family regulator
MQHVDAVRLARCLKAVCDPNRIQILSILVEGEFCVSDLVNRLGIDQPKVSHHLAILRDAGIIRSRRDGRHINYSIWPNVHRRQASADGPQDVFELGDLSVTFRFGAGVAASAPVVSATEPGVRPEPGQRAADADNLEASGAGAAG